MSEAMSEVRGERAVVISDSAAVDDDRPEPSLAAAPTSTSSTRPIGGSVPAPRSLRPARRST